MRWKALWARWTDSGDDKKINRKKNTVTSVSGRAAEVSGRRMSRAVTGVLLIVLAALTATVAWLTLEKVGEILLFTNPEYRLKAIDVYSDGDRVSSAKVKQWAEIETGMNMHAIDIARKRLDLLRRVPVLKAVEFKRIMPDRIEIRISERLPIAALGVHRALGVDQTGYVFAIAPSSSLLPVIAGYVDQISPGTRLQGRMLNASEVVDVLNRTPLGGLIRVELLDVREPDCLVLKLGEGPLVRLNWPDMAMSTPESRLALEAKLRSLAHVLDDARLKNRRLVKVDLTFTDDYIPVE